MRKKVGIIATAKLQQSMQSSMNESFGKVCPLSIYFISSILAIRYEGVGFAVVKVVPSTMLSIPRWLIFLPFFFLM